MDKNFTCPKCGKKMTVSTQSLIANEYKIICPQCLSQLQVVGDYAYVPLDDGSLQLDVTHQESNDITCPHCGKTVSSNAHFCPNCGSSTDSRAGDDVQDVTVLPPPLPAQQAANDPLYSEALRFLATCTVITPMMLRDRFGISDERAVQLLRQLEANGVVGPYNNGGPRQILIPHATMNPYNTAPQQPAMGGDNTQQPTTRRGVGGSCVTWFVVIAFAIFLFKSCTGM